MKKIKILFVNESLTLAGGEKSLIALLSNLDPEKYEIDLQLFSYGAELEEFLPDWINLLPPLDYTNFLKQSVIKSILGIFKKDRFPYLIARIKYSIAIRKSNFNHPEKAQLYWENVGPVIKASARKYDVAIAYAQGVPTYYVMDKISSLKKICWVNANMIFPEKNKEFQKNYYKGYDTIVPVSKITEKHFGEIFPDLKSRFYMIPDIVDYHSILKLSNLKEINFEPNTFSILTVSRLNKKMKGVDILAESCRILRDRGVNFHWYILGTGDYKNELLEFIKENHLEERLTLLGTDKNPYPYYKAANMYVQTSRSESYGIALAEARLLNLPIVTTRFDTVFEQMIDGKNGLVVDTNPEAIADGIQKLINDKTLYDSIVAYLKSEPKENLESVEKFDRMISKIF